MPTTKNLGIVSVVPADNWSSDANYQKANFVRNNKATYMAKAANRNIEPGVSPNWQQYWMLFNYDGVAAAPTAIPLPDAETGAIGDDDSYAAANHVHPMSSVYESAQDALNKAVKTPILTGSAISAENTLANAVTPFKVESKNLIPFPYYSGGTGSSITDNGITYTVNSDGSIRADGTATAASLFMLISTGKSLLLSKNKTYTLSGCPAGGNSNYYLFLQTTNYTESYLDNGNGVTFIPQNTNYYLIIRVATGATLNDVTFYPQLEVGDTATSYSPYVADGTAATVTACGKNLLPFPYYQGGAGTVVTSNGVTMTVNADGTITCAGTATGDVRFNFTNLVTSGIPNIGLKGGQTYWLSRRCVVNYKTSPDSEILGVFGYDAGTTFVWQDNYILVNVRLQFSAGTETNYTISPIIAVTEGGEVPYEPYNGQTYSTEVGESVEITQRDKYTNVFSGTDGVTVSGQFILSTQYELDDKLTPLFGTFANRPTTTQPYTIMYIATDQTGDNKVTILPANADGSVSGNWITI